MGKLLEGFAGIQQEADELRLRVLEMAYRAGSGHLGGSFSSAEILLCLYRKVLRVRPDEPDWPERDRFILSKGHAAPMLYAVLADSGFFPEDELFSLREFGSKFQGHPDMGKLGGIDISSGSLGMGLSAGIGMAVSSRFLKGGWNVFVLAGDGELDEGQNWEAMMLASKLKLDNLILIVDRNHVQLDGTTDEVMPLDRLEYKLQAFGWETDSVDGHNCCELLDAFEKALDSRGPYVIIANTTKGKGVPFMEGDHKWHGKPLHENEYKLAKEYLEKSIEL